MSISYWSLQEVKGLHHYNINLVTWGFDFFPYYVILPAVHYVACAAGLKLVVLSYTNLIGAGITGTDQHTQLLLTC